MLDITHLAYSNIIVIQTDGKKTDKHYYISIFIHPFLLKFTVYKLQFAKMVT